MALPKIYIAPVWITLRERSSPEGTELPVDGNVNHPSLFDIVENAARSHVGLESMLLEGDKALVVHEITRTGTRQISLVLGGGDKMQKSDIVDLENRKITGTLDSNHLPVQPFYAQLRAKVGMNRALLLTQKTGTRSIQSVLLRAIKLHVAREHSGYTIDQGVAIPENLYETMLKHGSLKELSLIKYGVSDNLTEVVERGANNMPGVRTVMSLKAPANGNLGVKPLRKLLAFKNGKGAREVQNIFNVKFEYDEVRIVLSEQNRQRTVNVSRPEAMRYTEDVSDRVGEVDGQADLNDLEREFNDLAGTLLM